MSNTRRISSSSFAGSAKSGCVQSMTWRVGAPRLPSCEVMQNPFSKIMAAQIFPRGLSLMRGNVSDEAVERCLEAAGMALLGLGQGLEPVGDFVKAFRAGGLGHARIHVGIF